MPRPKVNPSRDLGPATAALLELFAGPLQSVTFPGVDGAALQSLVTEVERAAQAVEAATTALAAAQAQLAEHQSALAAKTKLGVAYARVYAKDDADLLARLEGLSAPKRGGAAQAASVRTDAAVTATTTTSSSRRKRADRTPVDPDEVAAAE